MVYLRTRAEMPAANEEIEAMLNEGIKIDYLTLPQKFFSKNGTLSEMECIRMQLGEPDASGRRRPIPVAGSEFKAPVDTVIAALGQVTQVDYLKEAKVNTAKNGTVPIDPNTGATNVAGIFAGGDVVTGAAYVVDAIAAGKQAAISIDRYLKGESIEVKKEEKKPQKLDEKEVAASKQRFPAQSRIHMNETPVEERVKNFKEVALGFTQEQAMKEAIRCMAGQIEGCIEC